MFQWSRSEMPLGAIGKNITSVVNWTFDEDARDIVDEIEGIKSTNSSVVFVSWSSLWSCGRRMRDLSHIFSFLRKKYTRGEKGYEFLSYVLIMWL